MSKRPIKLHELPGPELALFAFNFSRELPRGGNIRVLIEALCDRFDPALKGRLPERILNASSP